MNDAMKALEEMASRLNAIDGMHDWSVEAASIRAALEAKAEPVAEGWKVITRPTCYQLVFGNEIVATLAGPNAEGNAAAIAAMLSAPPSTAEVRAQALDGLIARLRSDVEKHPADAGAALSAIAVLEREIKRIREEGW